MDDKALATLGDALLIEWGRFMEKRHDSGLGYPKISASFKDAVKGYGSAPLVPDSVFMVDRTMAAMRLDDKDVYQAAFLWYVRACPASICAARMRCSERTIRNRLAKVRLAVAKAVAGRM